MARVLAHFDTTLGKFTAELFEDKVPKTVANFVGLAEGSKEWTHPKTKAKSKTPYYDGIIFHRVIEGFMIQGGGFEPDMKQKPTEEPIENEANNGLRNDRYTIAMARTSAPHSATAQFFINTTDNEFLNFKSESPSGWGYAVFGKVVSGAEVVDRVHVAEALALRHRVPGRG